MVTATQAYERLHKAQIERTPECKNIDLFTADHLTPADVAVLEPICALCDLRLLCKAYVEASHPPIGFWAGKYYGPRNKPKSKGKGV